MNPRASNAAVVGWYSSVDAWVERLIPRWEELASIWTLAQFAIIGASVLVALGINSLIVPPMKGALRQVKRQPRLIRILAIVLRQTKWIVLAALLWLVASVMAEMTWPSRSYLIRVSTSLATAWALISILSRLIRSRRLAQVVAVLAWAVVALFLTDLLTSVTGALDAVAFSLGSLRISAFLVIKALLLFAVLLWLALFISDLVDRWLMRGMDVDAAIAVVIGKLIRVALLFMVFFASFSAIGIDLTGLAVFSGAVGLGVGFGLQKIASNLISGFIILLDRSIKPGDVISLGNTFGWITKLGARYVQVNTRDGVEYLIPNETLITERVANMSHTDRAIRLEIRFGVSYASDPHLVRRLAVDVATKLARTLPSPEPVCHIVGFGESSLDFVLRFWIRDPEMGVTNVRGEAFLELWDAFKEHNIAIPYPHREIMVRTTDASPIDGSA